MSRALFLAILVSATANADEVETPLERHHVVLAPEFGVSVMRFVGDLPDYAGRLIGGAQLALEVGAQFRRWDLALHASALVAGGEYIHTTNALFSLGPLLELKWSRVRLGLIPLWAHQIAYDPGEGNDVASSRVDLEGVGFDLVVSIVLRRSQAGELYLPLMIGYRHFFGVTIPGKYTNREVPSQDLLSFSGALGYRF